MLVCPAPRAFVLTLVPIAVAYHLAHYFSLLVTAGQFIIPLASDPFGCGWNLFGTAGYKVDLGIVSPYVFWYGAVTLIVVGHVIAVLLAHVDALRDVRQRRAALLSQLPMLALMVGLHHAQPLDPGAADRRLARGALGRGACGARLEGGARSSTSAGARCGRASPVRRRIAVSSMVWSIGVPSACLPVTW